MFRHRLLGLVSALALAAAASTASAAVNTVFSYQGQLKNSGTPVNGSCDFRFTLWDAPTVGTQIAGPSDAFAVPVVQGLFTTTMNFGPIPFEINNADRYVQVEVRNPAGSGSYITMSSRLPLLSAPLSASTRGIDVDQNGAVSITHDVSFGGPPAMTIIKPYNSALTLLSGYDGVWTAFDIGREQSDFTLGVACAANNFLAGSAAGDAIIRANNGSAKIMLAVGGGGAPSTMVITSTRVGIGLTNPQEALHVNGNILATGSITPSCAKLKENVEPMGDALDRLSSLDAVRFDWKPEEAKVRGFTHDLGFIAEEVAKVFPEVVFRDDNGQIMGLDYSRMSAVAVGAIKQLKAENDELKARLEKIEALLASKASE